MAKRRSAYELPFARVELTVAEQHQALCWWQAGKDYYPLLCPVCGATLLVVPDAAALRCPTSWCHYTTQDIPWGVYAAWQQRTNNPE